MSLPGQQLYDDPSRQLPAKAIMGGISAAMLEDNPLVVGGIWSTVTLKFIEACDDRDLNRQPGAKTESPRNSAHLTGLAWINSQERKPFYGCGKSRTAWFLSPGRRRPTIWVRFLPKA